jgi:hypothetical protein
MTRPMVALLLNPPSTTSGVRTTNAVSLAGALLGFTSVEIINLFSTSSPTVVELNSVFDGDWLGRRAQVREVLRQSAGLLGAWGVSGMTGLAGAERESRARSILDEARSLGFRQIWMVGGQPRHPSRWHQYVSDKHARTHGGTFDERLRQVMVQVPISEVLL